MQTGSPRQTWRQLPADCLVNYAHVDHAVQTFGGFGYAREFDVERLYREIRLYKIAPISQQMVLNYIGEHVLGMPRSY